MANSSEITRKPLGGQPSTPRPDDGTTLPSGSSSGWVFHLLSLLRRTIEPDFNRDSVCDMRQVRDENEAKRQSEFTEYQASGFSRSKCGGGARPSFRWEARRPPQLGPMVIGKVICLRVAQFLPERRVAIIMRVLLKIALSLDSQFCRRRHPAECHEHGGPWPTLRLRRATGGCLWEILCHNRPVGPEGTGYRRTVVGLWGRSRP